MKSRNQDILQIKSKNRNINKRIFLLFSGNLMNSNYLLEADIDSDYKHIKIRFVLFFERCCFFLKNIRNLYMQEKRRGIYFILK